MAGGPRPDLTETQVVVLGLIAQGFTNREISRVLFVSLRTVESHRRFLRERLGAVSRRDLVAAWERWEWGIDGLT